MVYDDQNEDNVNMKSVRFDDKKMKIETDDYYNDDEKYDKNANYKIQTKDTFGNNNYQFGDSEIKHIDTGTFNNVKSNSGNKNKKIKTDRDLEDLANFAESQRKSNQEQNNLSNIIIDNDNERFVKEAMKKKEGLNVFIPKDTKGVFKLELFIFELFFCNLLILAD